VELLLQLLLLMLLLGAGGGGGAAAAAALALRQGPGGDLGGWVCHRLRRALGPCPAAALFGNQTLCPAPTAGHLSPH